MWSSPAYFFFVMILTIVIIRVFFNLNPELGDVNTYMGQHTAVYVLIVSVAGAIVYALYNLGLFIVGSFLKGKNDINAAYAYYASLIGLFIVGIIWSLILLFNPNTLDAANNVSLIRIFLIAATLFSVISVLYTWVKSKKTEKEGSFANISEYKFIILVIIYIIGSTVFFAKREDKPYTTTSEYSLIQWITKEMGQSLVIGSMIIAAILFYISSRDVREDLIKTIILFICFIFYMIIMYILNPYDVISTYFGSSMVITILLAVFGIMYIISLYSVKNELTHEKIEPINSTTRLISQYGIFIILFIFLSVSTIGIMTYPGGFDFKKPSSVLLVSLIILISVILFIGLVISLFGKKENLDTIADQKDMLSIMSKIGMILSGLGFSCAIIYGLVFSIQNLSGKNGPYYFLINLVVVLAVLTVLYKILKFETIFKTNLYAKLILDVILYIPCLISSGIDATKKTNYAQTTYIKLLVGIIIAYVVYFSFPYVKQRVSDQGGNNLLIGPSPLTPLLVLGSYQDLNNMSAKTVGYNYNYGISLWVFLDSSNKNPVTRYVNILDFGGLPTISYNPSTTMLKIEVTTTTTEGTHIVGTFTTKDFLMQKWNNLVINYSGGRIDPKT